MHYLFFDMGQVKLSMDKYLVPGQISAFAISTALPYQYKVCGRKNNYAEQTQSGL